MPSPTPLVNLGPALLLLAAACTPTEAAPRPAHVSGTSAKAWHGEVTNGFGEALAAHPDRWRPDSLNAWSSPDTEVAPPPLPERVVADEVGARRVRNGSIDMSLGAALTERLHDFSSAALNRDGLGLLTGEELFGDAEGEGGLCEAPELHYSIPEGDEDYEASLIVYTYTALINDPTPMWVSISAGCVEGVASASGDLAAAEATGACAEDEVHTFFEEGSACRTCVETSGDYGACNGSGACPDEVPLAVWSADAEGAKTWHRAVYADGWGCAPDYTVPFYLMADYGEDGVLPATYDHTSWAYVCTPLWDEASESAQVICQGSEEPTQRPALAEGLFGYVGYLRPEGSDVLGYRARQYYVDEAGVDNGSAISWFLAYNPGFGVVSAPNVIADTDGDGQVSPGDEDYGYGSGGYGFNPHALRPGGESMARDWLAGITVKTATTINGVEIVPSQTNRCAEWDGPAADGSFRCAEPTSPSPGLINDLYVTWSDTEHTRAVTYPLTTVASTGEIDPDVPGGIVTYIAGSPLLANPDFDDCALPHSFTPDVAPVEDTPLDYGGVSALDAQTWRFDGKDLDFRVVLNTNRPRGWCGGGAEGGSRSVLDD